MPLGSAKTRKEELVITFELFLVALHVMVDSHPLDLHPPSGFSVDKKVNYDISDTESLHKSATCPL